MGIAPDGMFASFVPARSRCAVHQAPNTRTGSPNLITCFKAIPSHYDLRWKRKRTR